MTSREAKGTYERTGVLCFNCNGALGHVGDSVTRLELLIEYLRRSNALRGVEDLRKARHFIDLLIELETRPVPYGDGAGIFDATMKGL